MYITSLEIRDFICFREVQLHDLRKELYIVYGTNLDSGGSNGIGKSAIVEAIVTGIYGKSFRPSVTYTKELVRRGAENFKISISLSNDYKIIRTKNTVELYKDNKKVMYRLREDIDKEIEKLIPYQVFVNLNYLNPLTLQFFSLTPTQRFQVLSEILDLRWLDETLERVNKEAGIIATQIQNLENTIDKLRERKEVLQKSIQVLQTEINVLAEKLRQQIYATCQKNDEMVISNLSSYLQQKILNLLHNIKEYRALPEDDTQIEEYYNTLLSLYREVEHIKNNKVCPTCKRPFDNVRDENEFLREVSKFSSVDELYSELQQVRAKKEALEKRKLLYSTIQNTLKEISAYLEKNEFVLQVDSSLSKIESLQQQLEKLSNIIRELSIDGEPLKIKYKYQPITEELIQEQSNEQLSSMKNQINSLKEELTQIEDRISTLTQELSELQAKSKVYTLIKDELSVTGNFRKYIYQMHISSIADLMNRYMKELIPTFTLHLDIQTQGQKKGIVLNIKDDDVEKQYHNLSSGERRICDLCFCLALSNFGCDIVIIDEALNVLSEELKSRVIDLLLRLGKQIFVVEHDKEFVENLMYTYPVKFIEIVRKNGVSQVNLIS